LFCLTCIYIFGLNEYTCCVLPRPVLFYHPPIGNRVIYLLLVQPYRTFGLQLVANRLTNTTNTTALMTINFFMF
jgi:hypothetical protein